MCEKIIIENLWFLAQLKIVPTVVKRYQIKIKHVVGSNYFNLPLLGLMLKINFPKTVTEY